MALWKQTKKRPVVVGHSAGGHLTAEMLARDWSGFAGVPADLVQRGYAISGVFDLAPLIGTSINEAVGLTSGTARVASPLFRPPPPKGRRFIAAVGGDESSEFLRQSRDIAENWSKVGVRRQVRGHRRHQPLHGRRRADPARQHAVGRRLSRWLMSTDAA